MITTPVFLPWGLDDGVPSTVPDVALDPQMRAEGCERTAARVESWTKMMLVNDKASWRCVVCGVVERDGAILLVRQQAKDDPEGGWWVLPGGVVEAGESLESALRRELREETGLSMTAPTRLLFTVECNSPFNGLTFVFGVDAADGEVPGELDPDGIVKEAAWVPKDDALVRLAAVPYRRYAEPVAVLSGGAPEGSLWTYEVDEHGGDRLIRRLPA